MAIALNSNNLVTTNELEEILQITIADGDVKHAIINYASDFIEQYTGRCLKSTAYTDEKYSGDGTQYLFLKQYPITLITAVKSFDNFSQTVIQTLTLNQDFVPFYEEGYLFARSGWTGNDPLNYRVSYTAGYTSIPFNIKVACCQLANLLYTKKGDSGLLTAESIGNYSYNKGSNQDLYGMGIPDEIISVLNAYKIYQGISR
jgi:hypothetical protein